MQSLALFLLTLLPTVSTKCFDPSPAFPVPPWQDQSKDHRLTPELSDITSALEELACDESYDTSSFSVEITSQTETLWSHHHTARKHNATRPGATQVDGQSQYRIASITKTFTTLGILYQHAAGNVSLDDPISDYIPELTDGEEKSSLPWKDITLRLLASQLSGIPREIAQADLLNELPDPTAVGLPPASLKGLPDCYEYNAFRPCNWTHLLPHLKSQQPLFAPGQESTYSNTNFELLGLVLERVSGLSYEQYMTEAIFEPLGMDSTTLKKPKSDEHAVLPIGQYFWDVDEGVHNPTGGIYSTSSDMSKYLRYILTHYNALASGVNWFMPASWSTGVNSFYGMPWETFRTDKILKQSNRPVTFVTKSGGVPDYFSRITLMPEYGFGLTIIIGGESSLLDKIQEAVTVPLIRAAEDSIWEDMDAIYTGTYNTPDLHVLNSTLTLAASPSSGLQLTSFISNGTDVFTTLLAKWAGLINPHSGQWRVQLVPTLLYKNETAQEGEIWRLLVVEEWTGKERIWDDFCITDVDPASYAGLPINEVVFWHGERVVELPAWRVKMKREEEDGERGRLVVQQP
ncbi:hypothetical protein B0A55_06816 [Friedmanniomyces simplex]|uniref:Uncharacterized protein n=1 Tax=Friedmanniomyces simplex TaxID=329884 RepID=A0A4U0X6W9_9PEZI|nr:hypothetical protein B0A55_06816 [Friedmanniomyces simplex]